MMASNLILKKALETNRLDEFNEQEEARGVVPVDKREFVRIRGHSTDFPRTQSSLTPIEF